MAHPQILEPNRLLELLGDPVRFKIFTEIFVNHEITATELLTVLPINRSTLSHHLTKLVEENILKVRINPTGRAVKYYSLSVGFHKVEVRDNYNSKPENEKTAMLKLLVQQIGFELKVASNYAEKFVETIVNEDKIKDIQFSDGQVSYKIGGNGDTILNGGIFYTNKDHAHKFVNEIAEIVKRFKREVFEMSLDKNQMEKSHAVILGAFPLKHPIKIRAKKIVKKINK